MKIQLSHKATIQLRENYIYHKEQGNGMRGRKIRADILNRLKILKIFPELGKIEESFKEQDFVHRFLIEGNFKIIYRIEKEVIFVASIFDTRQNPNKM